MQSHFHITFSHCHISAPFVKMTIFEKKFLLESDPLQTVYGTISIITEAKNETVFSETQVAFEVDDYARTNTFNEGTRIQELVQVVARTTTVFDQTFMIAITEARSVFYEDELYEHR